MKVLPAVLAIALGSAAHAQTYECNMTNPGADGWIGTKMFFSVDPDEEVGAVLDWAIQEVHKAPIPVRVKKRTDTMWKFFWSVKGVKSSNSGAASLTYTAMLDTANNRVRVRGNLAGYDNNISGSGPCKLIKG